MTEDTTMPTDLSPASLYRVEECSDLMADACVCDHDGRLIFASLWGGDTAIQEFLARLTLASGEHGLDHFHLLTEEHASIPVFLGDTNRLEKRQTRALRHTLFGSLLHLWLFDKRCIAPDKANFTAIPLLPRHASDFSQRLWPVVQNTCPLPLLDHWRDSVLDVLTARAMLTPLTFALGRLTGFRLAIDLPAFSWTLGEMIRSGSLTSSPADNTPRAQEFHQAA